MRTAIFFLSGTNYGAAKRRQCAEKIKRKGISVERIQLIAPCHFGMEAVLKREIYDLGYDITKVEDGRVTFEGDVEAICRANIFLRTAERIMVQLGRFHATTFDELYEGVKALPWENWILPDGKFWVKKASTVKSKLFSAPDIQSIVKKAMVDHLRDTYHIEWFEESGAEFPVRIFLLKDEVTVALDTTGDPLHKRGYRTWTSKAPISETLAAALIMLTPWKADRILIDPFCGSGTFLIEAAMMAAEIAPGMNRSFTAEQWSHVIPKALWYEAIQEAREQIREDVSPDLQGYDIDADMVKIARENAKQAGVEHMIHFQQREVSLLRHNKKYGFIITNPPYGERLEEKKNLPALYGSLGEAYKNLDAWSMYLITGYEDAERYIGKKADKNRKIYNGMLRTYYYQFLGPKPPKREKKDVDNVR